MKLLDILLIVAIMALLAITTWMQEIEIEKIQSQLKQLQETQSYHNNRIVKLEYPAFTQKSYKPTGSKR